MVSLHDGKSRPQPVKLHLTNDALILLKEELVPITEEPVNEIHTQSLLLVVATQTINTARFSESYLFTRHLSEVYIFGFTIEESKLVCQNIHI